MLQSPPQKRSFSYDKALHGNNNTSDLFILFSVISQSTIATETRAGFFFPDDVSEVTFRYKSINGLIILPVLINDTVRVNLILDTGCRNLVLFGKKFQKIFNTEPDKRIQFSGLGQGDAIAGRLSLNNKVSIAAKKKKKIPVVLIPQQNLFATYPNIHGVIGYDIFVKFEIELDPRKHLSHFDQRILPFWKRDIKNSHSH